MKKYLVMTMTLLLAFGMAPSSAFADKKCGYESGAYHAKSVEEKFFKKVHMIYRYQDELGVSEKQLDQVAGLKVAFKKDLIKKEAEIDVIKLDLQSLLYKDEIDLKAVNQLIDQKYEIKKAKSKKAVESYDQLRKILSKEQAAKMKDMLRERKKGNTVKGSHHGEG